MASDSDYDWTEVPELEEFSIEQEFNFEPYDTPQDDRAQASNNIPPTSGVDDSMLPSTTGDHSKDSDPAGGSHTSSPTMSQQAGSTYSTRNDTSSLGPAQGLLDNTTTAHPNLTDLAVGQGIGDATADVDTTEDFEDLFEEDPLVQHDGEQYVESTQRNVESASEDSAQVIGEVQQAARDVEGSDEEVLQSGWADSISNVDEARAWVKANPPEPPHHVSLANDDLAAESVRDIHYVRQLFDALFKPPPNPNPNWTAKKQNYYARYQTNGMTDLSELLATEHGCKRAQSHCFILFEAAIALHSGDGLPPPIIKCKLDPQLRFSERMHHIIDCFQIKRVAEDIVLGNTNVIRTLVLNPKALLKSRENSSKNNEQKQEKNDAGAEALGKRKNASREKDKNADGPAPKPSRRAGLRNFKDLPGPEQSAPTTLTSPTSSQVPINTSGSSKTQAQAKRRRKPVDDVFQPENARQAKRPKSNGAGSMEASEHGAVSGKGYQDTSGSHHHDTRRDNVPFPRAQQREAPPYPQHQMGPHQAPQMATDNLQQRHALSYPQPQMSLARPPQMALSYLRQQTAPVQPPREITPVRRSQQMPPRQPSQQTAHPQQSDQITPQDLAGLYEAGFRFGLGGQLLDPFQRTVPIPLNMQMLNSLLARSTEPGQEVNNPPSSFAENSTGSAPPPHGGPFHHQAGVPNNQPMNQWLGQSEHGETEGQGDDQRNEFNFHPRDSGYGGYYRR